MNGDRCPVRRSDAPEGGFALLVLLVLVGAFGAVMAVAVNRLAPADSGAQERTIERLELVRARALHAWFATGAFPGGLDQLAAAAGLPADGAWRADPLAPGEELDYRVVQRDLRVRSRGPDRRLGTADDVVVLQPAQESGRARSRNRLRLLRAALLASPYRRSQAMTAAQHGAVRADARSIAVLRRRLVHADATARPAMQQAIADAAARIAATCAAAGCPTLPSRLTGGAGLLAGLGLPDGLGVDGFGRAMDVDAAIGFLSRGADGRRGTDDDF